MPATTLPESEFTAFKIDGVEFDIVTPGYDNDYLNVGARPMPFPLEITERFEVPRQPVAGYKTITQATEPVALKVLHFVVTTYGKDDLEILDGWNNYAPHEVYCHLLIEAPLLMYFESKLRRPPRTGMEPYAVEWDITMVEVNDNQ